MNKERVNECVRYILYQDASKIPVTKQNIKKFFTNKGYNEKISAIIKEAKEVLSDIYGYELVTTSNQNSKEAYFLVLKNKNINDKLPPYIDPQNRKLLFAALAHTFMKQTPVKADDMTRFLIEAGLMSDGENVMHYLNDFEKQKYLEYNKGNSTFTWGDRAHKEVREWFILEKVAKALDKEPQYFKVQYKEAYGQINQK